MDRINFMIFKTNFNMNTSKYYLFVGSGLLALIFTFFIDAVTDIGVFNEFKLLFHIKRNDVSYWKWYEFIYVISYYLIRLGVILTLLISYNRKFIVSVFFLFLISIVSAFWFFQNDYHPVWETYIPYLVSMIAWLYLGLTMNREQS